MNKEITYQRVFLRNKAQVPKALSYVEDSGGLSEKTT